MNVKAKGSIGEREVVAILNAHGYPAHRNEQMYVGGENNPDVSADGLSAWHMEVKRVERLNIHEAFKQAQRDSNGKQPIVIHRRNREPWLVTLTFDQWLEMLNDDELPYS